MKERSTARIEAGRARARAAIKHLQIARKHLDAACADLCSVIGGASFWRTFSQLSTLIDRESRNLDRAIHDERDPLTLQRDPEPGEDVDPHKNGCGGVR
jgi:hypothetical protein